MAYIALSGITGCNSPITGTTTGFDMIYNLDHLSNYYKKNITKSNNNDFTDIYMVVCIFNITNVQFKFDLEADRDTFYDSLPK